MPRIDPLHRDKLKDYGQFFEMVESILGFVPNSLLTMGRRPEILQAFLGLLTAINGPGKLPDGLKPLISYMVSRSAGCSYCQAHTAHGATHTAGVSQEKLEAVWGYETSPLFSDAERAVLRVAQGAGQVPNAVSDAEFAEMRKYFDDEQIVEIVAVISLFGFLNRWNSTMATELEEAPWKWAEQALAGDSWQVGKHAAE